MDYRQYLTPEQLNSMYAQDEKANTDVLGALEALAAISSGAVAEPMAGLFGILGAAATQDSGAASRGVEKAREALTYQPRRKEGQVALQNVAEGLAPIGEMIQGAQVGAGDYVFDKTESPLLAALTQAVVGGAPDIAGVKFGARALPDGPSFEFGHIGSQMGGERGAIAGFVDARGNPVDTDQLMQTRVAGTQIELPALQRKTTAGYLSSPLVSQIEEGLADGSISNNMAKGILDEIAANPRYAEMQARREAGGLIEHVDNMTAKAADWDSFSGRPMILLPADPTSVGMVRQIGGVKLKTPIRTEGGPMHADWQGDWASMEDAAVAKQGHANRVAEKTGMEPIYMYTKMDQEGSNFSTMASEGVLRYLESTEDLDPKGIELLNQKMKALPNKGDTQGIADDWNGYGDWQTTLNWLTDSKNKKGDTSLGNRRKAFMKVISGKEFQKYGAPDVEDVYAAINELELSGYPAAFSGFRAAESKYTLPSDLEYRPDGHGSYDTRIPLGQVFAMDPKKMIPWNVMFPDMATARSQKTPARAYRSAQTSGGSMDYQIADEKWRQGIFDYLGE